MRIQHMTLEGRAVRLEPLSMAHFAHLCEIGLEPELWRWIPQRVTTQEEMRAYIQSALDAQRAGTALPFATVERKTGRVIGSTRFGNMDLANLRVEIGWTWLGLEWQRTAANTEAKYLMLRQAFENWGCVRVELKTDSMNERSRRAIQRLGAKEEGMLRNHMVTWSGRLRHSVYYSVIDSEWPIVKAGLESKLARHS
jgi:RimJ/RimL family protein N-acetyltransferase